MADCHPDRKHEAKGLCYKCYQKMRSQIPEVKAASLRRQNAYRKANPEKMRAYERKQFKKHEFRRIAQRYGLTEEQFHTANLAQGGLCAICGKTNGKHHKLAIDHCHKTGVFRGLLCKKCNSAIGWFDDSIEILSKAIDYLRKSRAL